MTAYTIDLSSIIHLSCDQFDRLCESNPDVKFERTPTGELVIMPPTGGETGKKNAELITDFVLWNRQTQLGVVFDSSTCFRLPNGGDRSPDISWVRKTRWDALTPEEQQKFVPLCPDFVLELRSPSDRLPPIQSKMQEYLDSGVQLGWLLNPQDKQVELYRPKHPVEILKAPSSLSGGSVLPGFIIDVNWVWR